VIDAGIKVYQHTRASLAAPVQTAVPAGS